MRGGGNSTRHAPTELMDYYNRDEWRLFDRARTHFHRGNGFTWKAAISPAGESSREGAR